MRKSSNKPKIAIIGAGLAGLTAAYRLLQNDMNVTLYEAKNRVGGRILSIYMHNYLGKPSVFELGAHNITDGGEGLHFMNLVREFGLEIIERECTISDLIYYKGEYLNFTEELINFLEQFEDIDKILNALAAESTSIGALINTLFENHAPLRQALRTRMTAGYF